jgi:DNA polymerase lambda
MPPKKRKAAEAGPSAAAVAQPKAQEPQLFAGCHTAFWATKLTAIMMQRVQQLGGTVQPALTTDTTHVVCPSDITGKQAAAKLQAWKG